MSKRTNKLGADELQEVFPDIPVTTCDVRKGLHLKSSMTMFDDKTIIIGTSESSQFIKKQIEEKSKFINSYTFIEIDDVNYPGASNVLYFNERLAFSSHLAHLYEVLIEYKHLQSVTPLPNSEFFKIDGCLTCRSVLFCSGK